MHSAGLTSTYVKPPLKVFCLQGICFEEIIWSKPLINAHYSDFWGTSILPPLHALIGETEGHICKRYRSSSIWSQAYRGKRAGKRNFLRVVPATLHKLGLWLVDVSQALRDVARVLTSQNSVVLREQNPGFWLVRALDSEDVMLPNL